MQITHYQRLKVTRDAPIEVIRAAYRALAAKLHPDRHTHPESAHSDMVALNAAYEVLGEDASRTAYDLTLDFADAPAPKRDGPARRSAWSQTLQMDPSQDERVGPTDPPDTQVDLNWMTELNSTASEADLKPLFQQRFYVVAAVVIGVSMTGIGIWWIRHAMLQMQVERALSGHYEGIPKDTVKAMTYPEGAAAVAALARREKAASGPAPAMTNQELLALTPLVTPVRQTVAHPLDGEPLPLREEVRLVNPLGP